MLFVWLLVVGSVGCTGCYIKHAGCVDVLFVVCLCGDAQRLYCGVDMMSWKISY